MHSQSSPEKKRPRLLLATDVALPYVCGVSTIVDELTRHFSELEQWDVLVLAPDSTHPILNGIDVVGLPSYPVPMYQSLMSIVPFDPRVLYGIRQCYLDFQPDVIMTLGSAFLSRVASYSGYRMNIPVVGLNDTDFIAYATHYGYGYLTPLMTWLTRWVHRGNTVTLVSSPSYSERLRQIGFNDLKLWRFGINTGRFSPEFYNETLRQKIMELFPDTQLICLCVSRMASEKSIDDLYEIAKLDGVTLVLVGDGPHRQELEQLFSGTQSIFWGALYNDDLARMYASADVFLTASRSETFGLTVLEAMASGTPSVIIDGNGIRDTVVHEETGFIASSVAEMLDYVTLLRDDETLLAKMSQSAYKKCEDFSWETSIDNLNDILLQVADIAS